MPKKRQRQRIERRVLVDGTVAEYKYAPRKKKAIQSKSVSSILGAWEQSQEFECLGEQTIKAYRRYSEPLYSALKGANIADVKRRNLLAIRDVVAKKRGHGAAMAFCKVMAVFFSWAQDREYIAASPARDLKKSLIQGEWMPWTIEQALKAEAELPAQYARAIFLARWTAQRRGDLCKMRWDEYQNGEIYVKQDKTGVELYIPVAAPLAQALSLWRQHSKGETILQQPDGSPLNAASLSVRLPIELKRIGIHESLTIHGLRKLAAASLADAGCSPHQIAAITGHKTLSMVEHYTKSADQRYLGQSAVDLLVKNQILQNAKK